MNKMFEENFDEAMMQLETIKQKLEEKVHLREESKKKNSHLHIFLETSLMNRIKKEANEKNISIAELCRRKLRFDQEENKVLDVLNDIMKKLEKMEKNFRIF